MSIAANKLMGKKTLFR